MKKLPTHALPKNEFPITIKEIQHKNPYDFTREHRHSYFEIFFFDTGGGFQVIDFQNLPIKKQSSYIVFPGQVHLVSRTDEARGLVLQFQEEAILSESVKLALKSQQFSKNPAICFEENEVQLEQLKPLLKLIALSKNTELNSHLLYSVLLILFDNNTQTNTIFANEELQLYNQFLQLLDKEILQHRLVNYYANELGIPEKKLAKITAAIREETPLNIIHQRLILEIKRTLLFQEESLKEIAYKFDFDSPATFSQFIKSKTGKTPTELQKELIQIHR